ncbi:MAG: MBL fold metallo-hydrolase [Rhodobacteraceae bacterium]|nr:MBL fold metallo-hydrolase [Paracoccaceae bacterium]
MKPPFNLIHSPEIGVVEHVTDGLRVVTAGNASPMTFTGTRTHILGEGDVAVIDPGPDDPSHFAALCTALNGQRVSHVIVTHSHVDHSPLAKRLAQKFDAPVLGFGPSHAGRSAVMDTLARQGGLGGGEGIDADFAPDVLLEHGAIIEGNGWSLEAIHTPGHLSNHLCFAWLGNDALFSGDHVMGWATTLVSPPDGDLTQFMESLRKLQNRPEHTYYPGHGAPLLEAHNMLDYLLAHRLGREDQILAELVSGPTDIQNITTKIYSDIDQRLLPMASRNVLAHIIDLVERGRVQPLGALRVDSQFQLV